MAGKDTNIFDGLEPEVYLENDDQPKGKAPRPDRPIRMVAVDSITKMAEGQTREIVFDYSTDSQDQELADSIKEHGVIQAIGVHPLTKGLGVEKFYELVWGERRLAAAKHCGIAYVPAQIVADADDNKLLTVVENTGRKDLSEYERATALVMLLEENDKWRIADVVRMTGIKQGTAYNLVRAITDSPEPLRGLFQSGVSPRAIIELQSVFENIPEDDGIKFAKNLIGISTPDAETLNRQVKKGSSLSDALAFIQTMRSDKLPLSKDKQTTPTKKATAARKNVVKIAPPQINDGTYTVFSELTGVPPEIVERLANQLRESRGGGEVLLAACLYLSKSGDESNAIALAQRSFALRRVRAVLTKHLENIQRADGLITGIDDPDIKKFIAGLYGMPDGN